MVSFMQWGLDIKVYLYTHTQIIYERDTLKKPLHQHSEKKVQVMK